MPIAREVARAEGAAAAEEQRRPFPVAELSPAERPRQDPDVGPVRMEEALAPRWARMQVPTF